MMMGGGNPVASESPANPAAAQTDDTTPLDHLVPSTTYTVSGSLDSGPADGVVQVTLSDNGLTVPVSGASNNEGHLLRASDGYPQAFSFTFDSPVDVSGLQLRVLSATSGWVVTHDIAEQPSSSPPAEPLTQPTSQGEVPSTLPEVYESDASTDTPTEDLAAFQTHEPDPAVNVDDAVAYEIGWGTLVATALKAHGPNQAALDWVGGEIFYWHKIRDNAAEPLKSIAQQNATFWGGLEGRILGGTPVSPWNSETFLSASYKWGWYTTVMFNRPEGESIVGISTWNSNKSAYSSTEWP